MFEDEVSRDKDERDDIVLGSCLPISHSKPTLTVVQQIEQLKTQGVTFEYCSEEEAGDYLSTANSYLRTRSYRKLYPRRLEGVRKGEYVNLDFGSLVALASLDRQMRATFLTISVDIEHFAKMEVLRMAEDKDEDGYELVESFFSSLSRRQRKAVDSTLTRRAGDDEYAGALIMHYRDEMPLWVLVEVLDFGMFLTLYKFCANRWNDAAMGQRHYVLKDVKALRNACAHNHCIINGLSPVSERREYEMNALITDSLNAAGLGRSKSRRSKLQNLRVAQIAATLYASHSICTRSDTRLRHTRSLHSLRKRYEELEPEIRPDNALSSYFSFIWRLVDVWLSPALE